MSALGVGRGKLEPERISTHPVPVAAPRAKHFCPSLLSCQQFTHCFAPAPIDHSAYPSQHPSWLVPAVLRGNADPECNRICIYIGEPDPAPPGVVGAGDRDPGLGDAGELRSTTLSGSLKIRPSKGRCLWRSAGVAEGRYRASHEKGPLCRGHPNAGTACAILASELQRNRAYSESPPLPLA